MTTYETKLETTWNRIAYKNNGDPRLSVWGAGIMAAGILAIVSFQGCDNHDDKLRTLDAVEQRLKAVDESGYLLDDSVVFDKDRGLLYRRRDGSDSGEVSWITGPNSSICDVQFNTDSDGTVEIAPVVVAPSESTIDCPQLAADLIAQG